MNKWGFLNLLLAAALLTVLALLAAMHTNPAKRNDYWLKGMDESPAPADYSVNANLPEGQTLRLPPEGTLPQGAQPYHYPGGVEGANLAGKELKNPLDAQDPAVLERGKILYLRDCMPCHGVAGRADGPASMAKRDGGVPGTASLQAEHAKALPDGYIYNYITKGGLLMPSYAAQIDATERWKVVAWVRRMQKTMPENAPVAGSAEALSEAALVASTTPGYGTADVLAEAEAAPTAAEAPAPAPAPESQAPAAASAPGTASGDPWVQAQALIAKSDCLTCHNPDRKVIGPAFRDVAKKYAGKPGALAQLVQKVKNGGAGNWGQIPMSPHPNLSQQDLETIVKGVLSLGGGHAMAPSMKRVLELVHSGEPLRCPALAGTVNGPDYLSGREPIAALVRRVPASEADPAAQGLASLGSAGRTDAKEAQP